MSRPSLLGTTLLLSTALHAGALLYWQTRAPAGTAPDREAGPVLRISMAAPTPLRAESAALESVVHQPPAPPRPTPAPQREQEPPRERAPARLAVAAERPAPQPEAAPAQIRTAPGAASPDRSAPAPRGAAAAAAPEPLPAAAADRAGLRRDYLAQLIAHIEGFKQFPALARRRQVEGRVNVDLAVDCDGAVTALDTSSGPGLLRAAAQRSVRSAQPLPAPPPQLGCPQQFQYAMVYRLAR